MKKGIPAQYRNIASFTENVVEGIENTGNNFLVYMLMDPFSGKLLYTAFPEDQADQVHEASASLLYTGELERRNWFLEQV